MHDTVGNVWEWLEDCWHKTYKDAPIDGSAWLSVGEGDCKERVRRGGSLVQQTWGPQFREPQRVPCHGSGQHVRVPDCQDAFAIAKVLPLSLNVFTSLSDLSCHCGNMWRDKLAYNLKSLLALSEQGLGCGGVLGL